MADDRKAIHAYLTPEAHDAIHDFAAEEGVSVSGLLEALGVEVKALSPIDDVPHAVVDLRAIVKAARKIDAVRRRRGGS